MRIKDTSVYSEIKLAEKGLVPNEVQVLRCGSFRHPKYGAFQVTTATLAEMKQNFDNKIRGIDTAFDYFHESDKDASAWVKSLELREDGTELWAFVDWTPNAAKKLSDRELRYFSPDFAFAWTDPESGKMYNNVLFGGGLTNRPFVKEMQAIVASEPTKGAEMTELEKLKAENLKLSEDMKAMGDQNAEMKKKLDDSAVESEEVTALKKSIADLQAQLQKAQSDNEMMMAEKAKMQEAVKCAEKEKAFNVLLSEGKACAAQKDAFMKDDMNTFIKLAQPLNMKPNGSGAASETTGDHEDKVIKLAEEKMKASPGLKLDEAYSQALKELK